MQIPKQRYGSVAYFATQWARTVGLPYEIGQERLIEMFLRAIQVAHTCFMARDGTAVLPPQHEFVSFVRTSPPPGDAWGTLPKNHPDNLICTPYVISLNPNYKPDDKEV